MVMGRRSKTLYSIVFSKIGFYFYLYYTEICFTLYSIFHHITSSEHSHFISFVLFCQWVISIHPSIQTASHSEPGALRKKPGDTYTQKPLTISRCKSSLNTCLCTGGGNWSIHRKPPKHEKNIQNPQMYERGGTRTPNPGGARWMC